MTVLSRSNGSSRRLLCTLACLFMVGEASAAKPYIQVSTLGCATGVHLVADRAPVSEVLEELARVQGFSIAASPRISALITVDSVQSTQQLLAMILGEENTILKEEANSACPGRFRVAALWVVGKGSHAVGGNIPSVPKRTAPMTPEAKEQDDLYKRAHGMLPE